jgi:uncharacterized protein
MENQQTKTALITGAASGIGMELARLFAKDGYNLILVDRNSDGMDQVGKNLESQYGTQTTSIVKDLADPNVPNEIYEQTSGQLIDVLVNNAGFGVYGQFATETDWQQEAAMVQTNAVALAHLTKLYLKDMVARNAGKILLLGSEVSVIPNPYQAVYGATKAFIKSFGEAVRSELKGNKSAVTLTVLMPGATGTNFFRAAGAAHVKGAEPSKLANPADVARDGYEALMSGKDHVVSGFGNKLAVALGHLLPDPLMAAQVRSDMMPRDEEAEQRQQTILTAVAVGAVVAAGIWLLLRNRDTDVSSTVSNAYDKARYRSKAKKAQYKAQSAVDSVADSVKSAYRNAKSTVEDALA